MISYFHERKHIWEVFGVMVCDTDIRARGAISGLRRTLLRRRYQFLLLWKLPGSMFWTDAYVQSRSITIFGDTDARVSWPKTSDLSLTG